MSDNLRLSVPPKSMYRASRESPLALARMQGIKINIIFVILRLLLLTTRPLLYKTMQLKSYYIPILPMELACSLLFPPERLCVH